MYIFYTILVFLITVIYHDSADEYIMLMLLTRNTTFYTKYG